MWYSVKLFIHILPNMSASTSICYDLLFFPIIMYPTKCFALFIAPEDSFSKPYFRFSATASSSLYEPLCAMGNYNDGGKVRRRKPRKERFRKAYVPSTISSITESRLISCNPCSHWNPHFIVSVAFENHLLQNMSFSAWLVYHFLAYWRSICLWEPHHILVYP